MGELIEFPLERRRHQLATENDVTVMGPIEECTDIIHVFDEVPGLCKCGSNEWMHDHTIEPDGIGIHAVSPVQFDVTHFGPPAS